MLRRLAQEFPDLVALDPVSDTLCAFNRRREVHEPKRRHCCTECCKVFSRKADLQHHVARVHGENRGGEFECPKCQRKFLTKRTLHVHSKNGRCFKDKGRPQKSNGKQSDETMFDTQG